MKRILIIAGEASGDAHGAELIKAAHKCDPQLYFFGIGGKKMRDAGADIIIDNKSLAVVGIIEVLTHFKMIRKAYLKIKSILKTHPPELLILVDYPGFNLRIAKIAKKYNIKILYFISPQLWAWKSGRIKTIKACVDKMAVIFPFEVDFYRQQGMEAIYVGNSLVHQVMPNLSKDDAYQQFDLDKNKPIVGILPGSRNSEIKFIFNTLLETAKLLKSQIPEIQFVLPLANTLDMTTLENLIQASGLNIKIISDQLYEVLQLCNAAMVVSGTVTLEVALMNVPFVIIYKLSPISFYIGRLLVKIRMIGLCNIVAGEKIVSEFIQHLATPEAISDEMIALLRDKNKINLQRQKLNSIKSIFAQPAQDVGEVVVEMV